MGDAAGEREREAVGSATGGERPGATPSGQPANVAYGNLPADQPQPQDTAEARVEGGEGSVGPGDPAGGPADATDTPNQEA
jgi:hypothetical protein